jgi:hypothetical protein
VNKLEEKQVKLQAKNISYGIVKRI